MRIFFYPEQALRTATTPVNKPSKKIKSLVDNMFESMYEAGGIGLAAPQVGESIRVFIVGIPVKDSDRYDEYVFINPSIVCKKGKKVEMEEGCLSFPGIHGRVLRPECVDIRYMNMKGKIISDEYNGLLARVVQHEYDHLNGILFIDKMLKADKKIVAKDLKKLEIGGEPVKAVAM